jgi:hypothetical protein
MTEDSGAFKTNRRNSAQIGLFVTRESCGKDASPLEKRRSSPDRRRQPQIL